MKKLFRFSVLFLFVAATGLHNSFAQQTGDFYIGFPSPDSSLTEDSVHLHFHVPATYQPANPAKLIVGIHGLGNPQTPEQIRNYFSPTADSLYAIVVCPKPYITPPISVNHPPSQIVIDIAIDSVLQWYAIDTNEMYISGYSAGSDIASRYLLENPSPRKMKGFVWYAPGFFHNPDLAAETSFPITCLCFGDQDPLSNALGQIDSIRNKFARSPFDLFYNEIPWVEHTMEFPAFTQEMLECFRFFDDPENFVPDTPYSVGEKSVVPARLDFYPNPTTGKIFFHSEITNETTGLQVRDLSGKIVFELPDFQGMREIDLSDLAAGTYLVTLQRRQENYFKRLVLFER